MNTSKLILPLLLFCTTFLSAQTGYEGDNFSLEGALEIFKKSTSIEDFEKRLNDENTYVNNLDLNQDGEIDYLRVEDKVDGDLHAIVIQATLSGEENQDVAVIEIEKTGRETALLQIVGDEEIFGALTIVEPFEEEATAPSRGGPSADYTFRAVVVNVYFWSPVRFIYRPNYRPYVSPFRWRAYPVAWSPWRPRTYSVYNQRRIVYRRNYRVVKTHRVINAHRIYTPHRRTSPTVVRRTTTIRRVARTNNGKKVVTKKTTTTNRRNNTATNRTKKNNAATNKNKKQTTVKQRTVIKKKRKN